MWWSNEKKMHHQKKEVHVHWGENQHIGKQELQGDTSGLVPKHTPNHPGWDKLVEEKPTKVQTLVKTFLHPRVSYN